VQEACFLETTKENVLIIAGAEADRKVLTRYLEEASFRVTPAIDGRQGLELVQTLKPEVVLLDLHLAEPDAFQIVQSIASDEVLRIIPIIVLAAPADMEAVERCLSLGADDYLVRPFSATMLKSQVREFQAIRQRRHEERERAKERLREKIEHDVAIARDIQLGFLPSELPQPEGWEIAAFFQPAREVAGDFYDAFTMSQGRRVGFVIADVCDKGVGAALFMALIRSLTRAFAQQNYSLNLMDGLGNSLMSGGRRRGAPSIGTTALMNAVVLTNTYITTNHLQLNYFATLFFGMIDPVTGAMAYINGGHCPPVILGQNGEIKSTLKASGPAVGMLPDATFEIGQASLEPGDVLFAYTDGATDARDPNGRLFSEKRLMALIQQPFPSAAALLACVESTVRDHIASADPYDDITMMAVRRTPLPKATERAND
jgi:sigma-B regulation protein RsbU (phosphoserine phosphatase)